MEITKEELQDIISTEKRVVALGLSMDFESESKITIRLIKGRNPYFFNNLKELKLFLHGLEIGKEMFYRPLVPTNVKDPLIRKDEIEPYPPDDGLS